MTEEAIKRLKQAQDAFTRWDYFGTPIRVNLAGDTTYKTCFGACLTVIFAAVMCTQIWLGFDKMINRTDPDYSFYKLTRSWTKEDPLNVPEIGGQMYIGLLETKEYTDGSKVSRFIDFDPAYVNGKIDYYDRTKLQARKDMPYCQDMKDFETKIENSNGLAMQDFSVMRCIPEEYFEFYNVAGTSEQNSITLIFEECGGKYQKSKEFEKVILEQAEKLAAETGQSVDSIIQEEEEWVWDNPNCDPSEKKCDYGLEEPPEVIVEAVGSGATQSEPEDIKIVYEDCSSEPLDQDCVEYWNIECDRFDDNECLIGVMEATCDEDDIGC